MNQETVRPTTSEIMRATLNDDNKNKIYVTRNSRKHIRRYKHVLKNGKGFSTINMLVGNVTRNNQLLRCLDKNNLNHAGYYGC